MLKSLHRVEHCETKKLRWAKVPQVAGHDGVRQRIGSSFQHHFIGSVTQKWLPLVMRSDWLNESR